MKRERKPGEYGYQDTSYRTMGEEPGIRRLVERFYDAMARRPDARRILEMHPSDIEISRAKLTAFLCGWLGGPKRFSERYGRSIKLPMAHAHLDIGPDERDAWLACMQEAVDGMDVPDDFKTYFMREVGVPAQRVVDVIASRRAEGG